MEGLLRKQVSGNWNWQERHFVLTNGALFYYENASKTDKKGTYIITNSSSIIEAQGKANTLEVNLMRGNFYYVYLKKKKLN